MNQPIRASTAAILVAAAAAAPLAAQQVLLSEVRADATERWVEIHNRGSTAVDLSTWSLHYATHTTGMSQQYWWAFQNGTLLLPGGYLRVFWHQDPVGQIPAGEYYTHTSPYYYLFGLGGEQLLDASAAFALVDSQQNAAMVIEAHFVDWVSWGAHDFIREPLAVQNGTWTSGVHAPAIPPGQSLARNLDAIGVAASRAQEWFLDSTPTPMGPNISGMAVTSYGQACAAPGHHLLGLPALQTSSLPLLGNAQFGYTVQGTTGFYGETMLLAFATRAAPASQPSLLPQLPGVTCAEAIDASAVLAVALLPTQVTETAVPLSLAGLPPAMAGLELHAQALVFDWLPHVWPPYQGITNAVGVTVGH